MRSPEGKLSLYCKGADTIIYERLHQSCSKLMDVTTEHLNVSSVCVCVQREIFDSASLCQLHLYVVLPWSNKLLNLYTRTSDNHDEKP